MVVGLREKTKIGSDMFGAVPKGGRLEEKTTQSRSKDFASFLWFSVG